MGEAGDKQEGCSGRGADESCGRSFLSAIDVMAEMKSLPQRLSPKLAGSKTMAAMFVAAQHGHAVSMATLSDGMPMAALDSSTISMTAFPPEVIATAAHQVPTTAARGCGKSVVTAQKKDAMSRGAEESSFGILGLEIGHLSSKHQFAVLASGVMVFFLLYGYLQEKIVTVIFDRKFALFVSALQSGGYTLCCLFQRTVQRAPARKIPLKYYFLLGLMVALYQVLTNLSIQLLNYPAKVIFKSSRIIPVIIVGLVYYKKKYPCTDYLVAALMILGLLIFMYADATVSPHFSLLGVVYITIALFLDAININLQEDVMNRFAAQQDEYVLYAFAFSTVFIVVPALINGEFLSGLEFVSHKHPVVWVELLGYSAVGFMGVSCLSAVTKKFGAFTGSLVGNVRKVLTLLLSFWLFPKPVCWGHVVGGLVFFGAVALKMFAKKGQGTSVAPATAKSASAMKLAKRKPFYEPIDSGGDQEEGITDEGTKVCADCCTSQQDGQGSVAQETPASSLHGGIKLLLKSKLSSKLKKQTKDLEISDDNTGSPDLV